MNNTLVLKIKSVISKITIRIIDFVLPKEEKIRILENLGSTGLFENIPPSENFDFETTKIKAIFNYKTALCRQAIWEIKYRANKKLIRDFSELLYEYIIEDLSDLDIFNNFKKTVLLPIPSSRAREKEKGFNQCKLITRELIKIDEERKGDNFILWENFLLKKIDTPHQTKVDNRKKRLENLRGAFSVNVNTQSDIRQIDYSFIIIDDVITTGATMAEAFRALKSIGINTKKIRGYALAH